MSTYISENLFRTWLSIKYIIRIVASSIVILATALLIKTPDIIIDDITLPIYYRNQGFNEKNIGEKLRDKAKIYFDEVKTKSEERVWREDIEKITLPIPIEEIPDIILPNSKTSYRSIVRFFKYIFDFNSIHVRGEITINESIAELTIRNVSSKGSQPEEIVKSNVSEIDALITRGAISLVKISRPLVLEMDAYNRLDESILAFDDYRDEFKTLEEIAAYSVKHSQEDQAVLAYLLWGAAYSDIEKYDVAIDKYKKALELDPKSFQTHNDLGSVYSELKKYNQAIEHYNIAINLNSECWFLYNNLANAYTKTGALESAIDLYDRAINLIAKNPDDIRTKKNKSKIYTNLGLTLEFQNKNIEAIEKYKNAIELNNKNPSPYLRSVALYSKLKMNDEARKMLEAYPASSIPPETLKREQIKFISKISGISVDKLPKEVINGINQK